MRPSAQDIVSALDAYNRDNPGSKLPDGGMMLDGQRYTAEDAWKVVETHMILGLPVRSVATVDFFHELVLRLSRLEDLMGDPPPRDPGDDA